MGKPLEIKRRLPDGSFSGEPVKPFGGESSEEKIARLEQENANLTFSLISKDLELDRIESLQAETLLTLIQLEGKLNE